MSTKHITGCALLLGALFSSSIALAAGSSPTWSEMQGDDKPDAIKVVQFIDGAEGIQLVILGGGSDQGIVEGTTFKAYRYTASHLLVETGHLKTIEVQPSYTVASIETQGSPLSKAFFPKFAGVMGGDMAVIQRLKLVRRQAVMPALSLSYFDLFEDPKAEPTSFELKADGIANIRVAAATFANARLSTLMVEGYTDHHGPSGANQVESYQRALTVRQFLIDELGFDPARVVAVGFGEAEPADQSLAPGYIEANRRIVLKAVAAPER